MDRTAIALAQHETFETERLILRKIRIEDAADMFEFTSDPEVARFVTYEPHESIERTQDSIVNFFIPSRLYSWGIVDKSTNKVIGTIGLRINGDKGNFGWALHQAYWGQGIMPEVAKALRDFAFDVLELNVIDSEHYVENPKSGRVMEKIGMRKLGQQWIFMKKENKSVLHDYWAITREEYLNLRQDVSLPALKRNDLGI